MRLSVLMIVAVLGLAAVNRAASARAQASAAQASAAQVSGAESARGFLVAVPDAAGNRRVVGSFIRLTGVVNADGRVVEVPNLPGDSDQVARDDLVFANGTMHLISTNQHVAVRLDRATCTLTTRIAQSSVIEGGTGDYTNANGSSAATVVSVTELARTPAGACAIRQLPVGEIDILTSVGTLAV